MIGEIDVRGWKEKLEDRKMSADYPYGSQDSRATVVSATERRIICYKEYQIIFINIFRTICKTVLNLLT